MRTPNTDVAAAVQAVWTQKGGRADNVRFRVHHDADDHGTVTLESVDGSQLTSRFRWRVESGRVVVEAVNW